MRCMTAHERGEQRALEIDTRLQLAMTAASGCGPVQVCRRCRTALRPAGPMSGFRLVTCFDPVSRFNVSSSPATRGSCTPEAWRMTCGRAGTRCRLRQGFLPYRHCRQARRTDCSSSSHARVGDRLAQATRSSSTSGWPVERSPFCRGQTRARCFSSAGRLLEATIAPIAVRAYRAPSGRKPPSIGVRKWPLSASIRLAAWAQRVDVQSGAGRHTVTRDVVAEEASSAGP